MCSQPQPYFLIGKWDFLNSYILKIKIHRFLKHIKNIKMDKARTIDAPA